MLCVLGVGVSETEGRGCEGLESVRGWMCEGLESVRQRERMYAEEFLQVLAHVNAWQGDRSI